MLESLIGILVISIVAGFPVIVYLVWPSLENEENRVRNTIIRQVIAGLFILVGFHVVSRGDSTRYLLGLAAVLAGIASLVVLWEIVKWLWRRFHTDENKQ